MASREMLSIILKNTIKSGLKCQHHPVRKVLVKNAPCIANVVYRKLSTSILRKDAAHDDGKIVQRTPDEITKYVKEEMKDVSDALYNLIVVYYNEVSLYKEFLNENKIVIIKKYLDLPKLLVFNNYNFVFI